MHVCMSCNILCISFQLVLRDCCPVQLQSYKCSCTAGDAMTSDAMCNHVAALPYQNAHYCQQKITAVPPTHSCTENEQKWHKPRTMVTNYLLCHYPFDFIHVYWNRFVKLKKNVAGCQTWSGKWYGDSLSQTQGKKSGRGHQVSIVISLINRIS